MSLPKFTPHMISNQPDQTAYLLNKLVQEGVGGTGGGGGDIHLYPGTGQHTDGAMTQKATTDALGLKADSSTVSAQLANKVDKEAGKGLSSNDFTDEDESKLDGIQAGAEVNVQADWDQSDTSADDYIKNKPTIPAGAVLYNSTGQNTDGAMTQKASTDLFNVTAYIDTGTIGSPTPWIQTSDIVDGAVTASKIDLGSLNHTTIPSDSNGVDVTLSNSQSGKPAWVLVEKTGGARLGLGVDDTGSNHGIWSTPLNKWMIYSDGTYVYVNGIRIDDYRIKQYLFTTVGGTAVPGGADLNSTQYCSCGMYYCSTAATGSTITNNPSGSAFSMEVRAAWDDRVEFSGTWCYKFRIMYGYGGMWYQLVYTNGSGTPIYGAWKQLHNA